MSLLNDALRDLERRKGSARASESPQTGAALPQAKRSKRYGHALKVGLALVLVSGAVVLGRHGLSQDDDVVQVPAAPEMSEAVASPAPVSKDEPSEVVGITTPDAELSGSASSPAKMSATAPEALDRSEEHDGFPAPVELADNFAAPVIPIIAKPAPAVDESAPSPAAPATPQDAPSVSAVALPEKQNPEASPTVDDVPTAPTAPVRQQPQSAAARDQRLATAVERLLVEGQEAEAERMLNEGRTADQSLPRSHATIASYYLAQQRLSDARRWLPASLAQEYPGLRLLRGRLVLMEKGVESALRFLETDRPGLAEAPDYHATLASLYQQSGNAAAAGDRWGALLETDNRRADWWLGLALALDSQNQLNGALVAYAEALALPDLPPRLRGYAESRLRDLQ